MVPLFLAQVLWLQGFPDKALELASGALAEAEAKFGAFDVAANLTLVFLNLLIIMLFLVLKATW